MSDTSVVVIGGGISGLTTAIEAAEAGCDVHIVERNPYLGGRVAQLNKYFPKLCPPVCGLEINMRRIKENPRIKFHTLAEVKSIKKSGGGRDGYSVSITENPRYVNGLCVGCGECAKACPAERPNDFNFGMDSTKAAYLPFEQAFPFHYVIDRTRCKGDCGNACVQACKYNAIELGMKPGTVELEVDSVVLATGWDPYDAARMETLGYGRLKNVITNMMMERLAAPNGPTQGRILRPSDGREAKRVAFVQCAGSRDEDHLPYCSYVCCMASIKQAKYLRDLYPDSTAEIFYIDMRTPGRYEQFYEKVRADQNVTFTKGKVAKVQADPETGDVVVVAEDVLGGKKIKRGFDMVVLATGMQPAMKGSPVPGEIPMTGEGFVNTPALTGRLFAVGTAKSPVDVARSVQDGTGVAIKAMRGGGAARPSDKGSAHPSDKRAARPSDKRAAARQGGRADG